MAETTKTRRVVFLMDPDEHNELVRRAAAYGMSVAAWVRAALDSFDIRGSEG